MICKILSNISWGPATHNSPEITYAWENTQLAQNKMNNIVHFFLVKLP